MGEWRKWPRKGAKTDQRVHTKTKCNAETPARGTKLSTQAQRIFANLPPAEISCASLFCRLSSARDNGVTLQ
ncbi:uncharacterized protein K452DRAFT_110947 [Aplosporella prunicola CBS 121167]|uniref:Uncharacterized protein n=1 Tax=Aplosporella prunicola CBS 121167 TaxID=1176127 RepID=A0A6A6B350_9PEZI|nr:uncharacterized protein K452DRAFT_110947 [Aplosporella prunicola CBS 121167]KAF2137427.1 hypothetical protein K452DRAFT_110947 [Aplosporella prunicola CBS 121167]